MKINKILLIISLLMFISTGVLASGQDISITIDGVKLQTDAPAKIVNNRTLVPMRAIFEAMGAKVEWDNSTRIAIGTKGNDKIMLQIGNSKASINGKEVKLDSPAIIVNGSTLVPARFIAEGLGADVTWNNKTRTVTIESKPGNLSNYEKAYKTLVTSGELQKTMNKAYDVNPYHKYEMPFDMVEATLYDIDKDGIPELLLEFDSSGASTPSDRNIAVYEIKDGKAVLQYSDMGMAGSGKAHSFSKDKISGELYIYGVFRYYIDVYSYEKNTEPKSVYHRVGEAGGDEVSNSYKESWFEIDQIERIHMKPLLDLNFLKN